MIQNKDGLSFKTYPRSVSVFLVFLILTHKEVYGGESQQTSPPQSVTVMVSDDVVLPCQLDPPTDAVSTTIEWGRPDLDPSFVYVWHDGKELLVDQNEAYKGRASFSIDKLKRGDLSLNLSNAKISDSGTYRCYIPKLSEEYFVALLVGAVSSPVVRLAGTDGAFSGRVVLQCESGGWHPKPEVLWLDGEGKLLSAGPPETVRGPDDLYTVSSRVTVEKRHSNSFTCRVQQKDINQTREAHIQVPDDFFMTQSGCTPSITFSVLFGFMFISAVVFLVWKQRQYKMDVRREELKNEDDLQNELKDDLQRNDEEQNEITKVIETLEEVIKEMKNQKEKLNSQMQETEKQAKENEEKVNSVEKEVTEMAGDKTENRAKGYRKLKEILIEVNKNLVEGKNTFQQLGLSTDKLINRTNEDMKRITERKKKVEKNFEQITKQLEEVQKERGESQMELQSKKGGRIQDNKMQQIL